MPEYVNYQSKVRKWCTIQVAGHSYSVPSRLIGKEVQIRLYADWAEVYYKGHLVERMERVRGAGEANVNYRHVIGSLVRKPGAFARYRFREQLFPTMHFRLTYDALREWRRPVRHPGQSVGQLDQRIRRSGHLRWDQPAGGCVGQTVDARVVTVPVHHQAGIVGHVATHVPPLDAAFVIAWYVRIRQDRKRQTARCRRSVAHRFTSLRMAPGVQVPHSGCSAPVYRSDCKSVSVPAELRLVFLEADQPRIPQTSTSARHHVSIDLAGSLPLLVRQRAIT